MLIIGLTGSIATGKSTVSRLLSSPPYSIPIIDADVLARGVVAPGTPGYNAIVAHFLPTTPDLLLPANQDSAENVAARGRPLDRAALGRRVFGSSEAAKRDRKVLNSIVHPAVRRAMFFGVLRAYLRGEQAVVLDVPLLFESALDVYCGVVIVVGVRDPDVQLRRLLNRDAGKGLTEAEARDRVQSQGNVEGKVRRAQRRGKGWGEVVWNDGGKEELQRELAICMESTLRASPRWWAWLLLACPPLAVLSALWSFGWGWRSRKKAEKAESTKEQKAKL